MFMLLRDDKNFVVGKSATIFNCNPFKSFLSLELIYFLLFVYFFNDCFFYKQVKLTSFSFVS